MPSGADDVQIRTAARGFRVHVWIRSMQPDLKRIFPMIMLKMSHIFSPKHAAFGALCILTLGAFFSTHASAQSFPGGRGYSDEARGVLLAGRSSASMWSSQTDATYERRSTAVYGASGASLPPSGNTAVTTSRGVSYGVKRR